MTSIQEEALAAYRQIIDNPEAIIPWEEIDLDENINRHVLNLRCKVGPWADFTKQFFSPQLVRHHAAVLNSSCKQSLCDDIALAIKHFAGKIEKGVAWLQKVIAAVKIDFDLDIDFREYNGFYIIALRNLPSRPDLVAKYEYLASVKARPIKIGFSSVRSCVSVTFKEFAELAVVNLRQDLQNDSIKRSGTPMVAQFDELERVHRFLSGKSKAFFPFFPSLDLDDSGVLAYNLGRWFSGGSTITIIPSPDGQLLITSLLHLRNTIDRLQVIQKVAQCVFEFSLRLNEADNTYNISIYHDHAEILNYSIPSKIDPLTDLYYLVEYVHKRYLSDMIEVCKG